MMTMMWKCGYLRMMRRIIPAPDHMIGWRKVIICVFPQFIVNPDLIYM